MVLLTNPWAHAALAMLQSKREFAGIPVNYLPASESSTLEGVDENKVLILGFNGRYDKLAFKYGVSLPRIIARLVLENEGQPEVGSFLTNVENIPNVTVMAELVKNVTTLVGAPAIAARAITSIFTNWFKLTRVVIPESDYVRKDQLAIVEDNPDPFAAEVILRDNKEVDVVVQKTATGTQIFSRPNAEGLVAEVRQRIQLQGIAVGDGLARPQTIGNTTTFGQSKTTDGKLFPTFAQVTKITEQVCGEWFEVKEPELVTA